MACDNDPVLREQNRHITLYQITSHQHHGNIIHTYITPTIQIFHRTKTSKRGTGVRQKGKDFNDRKFVYIIQILKYTVSPFRIKIRYYYIINRLLNSQSFYLKISSDSKSLRKKLFIISVLSPHSD